MQNSRGAIEHPTCDFFNVHVPTDNYEEEMKFSNDHCAAITPITEGKVHYITNYVGMKLEELRYTCEGLKS